jgi:hypothetical protein
MIRRQGREYTIRNATGGSGGRDTPDYADDGTLTAILERRRRPQTMTDSAGEDLETSLQLRAVPDASVTLQPAGTAGGYPTLLVHPDGPTYRLIDDLPEDGGVRVLTVVRD